ncbi:MAG: hypothetical protein DHS20C02_16690 [Micavibrio sp.]|nr:MAG: hypothetical protein DHS20C02_16690 [Micavibrio sp.]
MRPTTMKKSRKYKMRKETGSGVKRSGYTLIEMAIVMIVAGVMIGAFISVYDVFIQNRKVIETEISLSEVTVAIGNFRAQYGRYPCPASLTAPRGTPEYGNESDDNCLDFTEVTTGTCDLAPDKGYCVEQSERAIDHDDDGTIDHFPRVRRGAIPFRNLNIAEEFAYDGYGNRLTYVVTERLAFADTFNVSHGGISIVDDTAGVGQSLLEEEGSGHFLILSPGENNAGAYNNNGVLVAACPPATTSEGKNCDINNTDAKYVQTDMRTTYDNTRFDDRLSFFSSIEMSLWQRTALERNDIEQRPDGFVGINDVTPNDVAEVVGNMRASGPLPTDGKLQSEEICDPGEAGCFDPELIGGTPIPGLNCPSGFVVAIENGGVRCENTLIVGCPPNELVVGVNPDGTLQCKPKGCPAGPYNFCTGVSDLLPQGADGDMVVGPTTGTNFTCNTPSWVPDSQPASCCVPGTTTTPGACPPGFTGTGTVTTTTTCSPPNTTTTTGGGCTCVGGSVTRTVSCPAGQTGKIVEQGNIQCPSGSTGGWTVTLNTCQVPPGAVCSWQPINQTGMVRGKRLPRPRAGSSCGCGSKNRSCFTVGIPGILYRKYNCRCSVN